MFIPECSAVRIPHSLCIQYSCIQYTVFALCTVVLYTLYGIQYCCIHYTVFALYTVVLYAVYSIVVYSIPYLPCIQYTVFALYTVVLYTVYSICLVCSIIPSYASDNVSKL